MRIAGFVLSAVFWVPVIISAQMVSIGRADPLDLWRLTTPAPTKSPLSAVAFGNGQFVAIGGGPYSASDAVILRSTDGMDWVKQPAWTNSTLLGVSYANRQFLLSGDFGIATSPDAVNWVAPLLAGQGGFTRDIVYGNGLFVVVGAAGIGPAVLISSDGIRWITSEVRGPFQLNAVAYGNGRFVAVGEFGALTTSTDGTNWSGPPEASYTLASNSPPLRRADETTSIAYGGGRFVFVDNGGNIGTSTDGLNWIMLQISPIHYLHLNSVAYGDGRFVGVGQNGLILSSSDGYSWVQHPSGMVAQLQGITYGNGHFVAVGEQGTVLESGAIVNLSMTPSLNTGLPSLSLEGPAGLDYTIQASNDLVTWKDMATITASPSSKITLEGLRLGPGNLFYRAQSR